MIGKVFRFRKRLRASAGGEIDEFLFRLLGLALGLFELSVVLIATSVAIRGTPAMAYALAAAGFALALSIGVAIAAARARWAPFLTIFFGRQSYEYTHKLGSLQYLDEVIGAGRRSIGRPHPDAETLVRQMAENQEILHVYGRERGDGRISFCGYIILYPLSEETGRRILSRGIRSAAEFGAGALNPDFETVRYLYIGMLLGTDRHSQPHITAKLRDELREILKRGRVVRVFARPATPYGEGLMKRYGFMPLGGDTEIWSVSGQRLLADLWQEDGSGPAAIGVDTGVVSPGTNPLP